MQQDDGVPVPIATSPRARPRFRALSNTVPAIFDSQTYTTPNKTLDRERRDTVGAIHQRVDAILII